VLHNLCIDNNDDFNFKIEPEYNVDEPYNEARGEQEALLRRLGEIKRNILLERLFP